MSTTWTQVFGLSGRQAIGQKSIRWVNMMYMVYCKVHFWQNLLSSSIDAAQVHQNIVQATVDSKKTDQWFPSVLYLTGSATTVVPTLVSWCQLVNTELFVQIANTVHTRVCGQCVTNVSRRTEKLLVVSWNLLMEFPSTQTISSSHCQDQSDVQPEEKMVGGNIVAVAN